MFGSGVPTGMISIATLKGQKSLELKLLGYGASAAEAG